ncbi:MAG: S8 family serine peptidase [Neomegalonema sp.]
MTTSDEASVSPRPKAQRNDAHACPGGAIAWITMLSCRRVHKPTRNGCVLAAMLGVFASNATAQNATQNAPQEWLRLATDRLCSLTELDGLTAQTRVPGAWLLSEERRPPSGPAARVRIRLALPGGDELVIERRQSGARLRQFMVEHHLVEDDAAIPNMQSVADGGCVIRSGRRLRRDDEVELRLEQLDGDLKTVRWTETLQTRWLDGVDPGGPRVAFVDSGLAYDLPIYKDRLARDAAGRPFGYDYWDLDPWPYDGDVSRGAFFPIRHGSAVASVFAMETANAALIPYRYPRPDMNRMGDLVANAVAAGAKVIAMPLGSRRIEDWRSFERAMREHDVLAIVSAGNDGRDLDTAPIWPAALALDNMIVVTSSDGFGRLAEGSNWGASVVDLMLPAENRPIVDFRGANATASGSSYAVPRLAALAARLLAEDPTLGSADLKQRIFARATPSPFERDGVVRIGWIADPTRD